MYTPSFCIHRARAGYVSNFQSFLFALCCCLPDRLTQASLSDYLSQRKTGHLGILDITLTLVPSLWSVCGSPSSAIKHSPEPLFDGRLLHTDRYTIHHQAKRELGRCTVHHQSWVGRSSALLSSTIPQAAICIHDTCVPKFQAACAVSTGNILSAVKNSDICMHLALLIRHCVKQLLLKHALSTVLPDSVHFLVAPSSFAMQGDDSSRRGLRTARPMCSEPDVGLDLRYRALELHGMVSITLLTFPKLGVS